MSWGKNLYDLVRIPVVKRCNGYYVRWWYNGWHYWFFIPGQYSMNTQGEKYRTIGSRTIRIGSGQVTRNQALAIRTVLNTREVSLWTIAGWMNVRVEPGEVEIYDNQIGGGELEFLMTIGSKEITYLTGYSPVLPVPIIPATVSYCEVTIGSQIWMCKNFDSNYPGSKVYYNDENNRPGFGGLYTFDQVMSPGFCPAGYHVPTLNEWQTLINFVGGDAVASGELKEAGFTHWSVPNTGAVDTYGFAARGAGYFDQYYSSFFGAYETAIFWTASAYPATNYAYAVLMNYLDTIVNNTTFRKDWLFSVRLLKDIPNPGHDVLDFDGASMVTLSAHPDLSGNKTITWKMWLDKDLGYAPAATVFCLGATTTNLFVELDANEIRIGIADVAVVGATKVYSITGLDNQTLTCEVVKSANSIVSFTVNGIAQALASQGFSNRATANSIVGALGDGSKKLDDATVWDIEVAGIGKWAGEPAGNLNPAWVDEIGVANGTVSGFPGTRIIW